jgi:hypothetical protein
MDLIGAAQATGPGITNAETSIALQSLTVASMDDKANKDQRATVFPHVHQCHMAQLSPSQDMLRGASRFKRWAQFH